MAKNRSKHEDLLDEIVDKVIDGTQTAEDLLGEGGVVRQLTARLLERVLEAEMTDHLGYEKHNRAGQNTGNSRNGKGNKTLRIDSGEIPIAVPRDRNGDFEPQIVNKGQRRLKGFDDKVISLYARGLTTREIQEHLKEIYGVQVSPALISRVTDAVQEEVKAWQNRPLDEVYPIVYLDAIFVKIRDNGVVANKAIYLALGINLEGEKELLGLWTCKSEGAKFWLSVLTELQNRGVKDVFIACVDGLKSFPEAIESVFPETQVQLCIVHLVRNSLRFVSWKDRKQVVSDLKPIYRAATLEEAEINLVAFEDKWIDQYPSISKSWRKNWEHIIPFFAYPTEIRKVIYTTNAIESLNNSLRKVIKNRGSFPSDEAAIKLLYLALRNASRKWTRPIQNWKGALNRFAIMFDDRVPIP